MRILAVYRHYWPDTTPYARLLRMILERLAGDGHDVAVISGQPSYNDGRSERQSWNEQLGGVHVQRVPLLPERKTWRLARALNALLFLTRAVFHATFVRRYDLIVANAQPPIAIGVALRIIAALTGSRYVLHLQDIHPEAASLGVETPGWAFDLLRKIDAKSCSKAGAIITLSTDMAASLRRREPAPAAITIINNCQLPEYEDPTPPESPELWSGDATKVLFAGNLGRFQHLEALTRAAGSERLRGHIELAVMGAGVMRDRIDELADPETTRLFGRQPLPVALQAMRDADYGVVSLNEGIIDYAYPSKTLAYLAAGLPLLLVVERDSELARMVLKHDLGVVAKSHRVEDITSAFEEAVERRHEWTSERRRQIAAFYREHFGEDRMLDAWSRLVSDLHNGRETAPPSNALSRAAA